MEKIKELSKKAKENAKDAFTPKTQPKGFLDTVNKATDAAKKMKQMMSKVKLYAKFYIYACIFTWLLFVVIMIAMTFAPSGTFGESTCTFQEKEIGIEPTRNYHFMKSIYNEILSYFYGQDFVNNDPLVAKKTSVVSSTSNTIANSDSSANIKKYGIVKLARDSLLLDPQFQAVKMLCIILAIVLIGLMFTIGTLEMKMKDVIGLCVKLTLVSFLTSSSSIYFYDNYILKPVFYSMDYIVYKLQDAVFSYLGKTAADIGSSPLDVLDGMFTMMFTDVFFFKILVMFDITFSGYTCFIVLLFTFFILFAWTAKDVMLFLLMAKISIAFCFTLMPLMILLFLFSATRKIGESFIEDFLIEPLMTYILVNLFLSIMLVILLEPVYAIFNYKVCSYSLADSLADTLNLGDWKYFLLVIPSVYTIFAIPIFWTYNYSAVMNDVMSKVPQNTILFGFYIWFFKENIPLIQSTADKLANAFNFNPKGRKAQRGGGNESAMMAGAKGFSSKMSETIDNAPRSLIGGVQKDGNGNIKTDKFGNPEYDKGLLGLMVNPALAASGKGNLESMIHGKTGLDVRMAEGATSLMSKAIDKTPGFKGAGTALNGAFSDDGLKKQGWGTSDKQNFVTDKARHKAADTAKEFLNDNDDNFFKARDAYVKDAMESGGISKLEAQKQFYDVTLNYDKDNFNKEKNKNKNNQSEIDKSIEAYQKNGKNLMEAAALAKEDFIKKASQSGVGSVNAGDIFDMLYGKQVPRSVAHNKTVALGPDSLISDNKIVLKNETEEQERKLQEKLNERRLSKERKNSFSELPFADNTDQQNNDKLSLIEKAQELRNSFAELPFANETQIESPKYSQGTILEQNIVNTDVPSLKEISEKVTEIQKEKVDEFIKKHKDEEIELDGLSNSEKVTEIQKKKLEELQKAKNEMLAQGGDNERKLE
jgi:type IV secretory pathway VirB6-like protein